MGKREFIASRRDSWAETEKLLSRVKSRGIKSLGEDELLRFGTLYRQAAADLAKAKTAEPFGDVTLYLNRLVSQTHAVIYAGESQPLRSFWKFISVGFPQIVRKHSRVMILSTLIFLLPALLGYYWMSAEPRWMYKFFPQIAQLIEQMEGELKEGPALLASGSIQPEMMPMFSSFIMVNNIRVSIIAFSSGITFGLGTAYSLITNGAMLGGVAYLYLARPLNYNIYFLAGILPHGVIELTAIVFSGAAGFLLAGALIMPGNLRRVASLQYRGYDAIRIMYGVVVMLVIAGLIEAFITPIKIEGIQNTVDYIKIAFSIIVGILMILYFTMAGRGKEPV